MNKKMIIIQVRRFFTVEAQRSQSFLKKPHTLCVLCVFAVRFFTRPVQLQKMKHILLLPVALFLLAGCSAAVQETAATEPSLPVGPTTYCQTLPTFVQEIGFTQPFLSTSLPDYIGAALGDLDSAGNLINVYQHP
ncbi:hypothetical protein MNBD_CHLOROFLEXI01-275, partial [hydrothermal vent metagenome]